MHRIRLQSSLPYSPQHVNGPPPVPVFSEHAQDGPEGQTIGFDAQLGQVVEHLHGFLRLPAAPTSHDGRAVGLAARLDAALLQVCQQLQRLDPHPGLAKSGDDDHVAHFVRQHIFRPHLCQHLHRLLKLAADLKCLEHCIVAKQIRLQPVPLHVGQHSYSLLPQSQLAQENDHHVVLVALRKQAPLLEDRHVPDQVLLFSLAFPKLLEQRVPVHRVLRLRPHHLRNFPHPEICEGFAGTGTGAQQAKAPTCTERTHCRSCSSATQQHKASNCGGPPSATAESAGNGRGSRRPCS
mmetsp:Transcript_167014/g.536243  ORF Transcript_167014/g.536243 Transcript_167014/m.536243 type:complete len:294 (+) Transcript_167014:1045-1926(+)